MKRRQRQTCAICRKEDVAHYADEPHGTHVKSKRHQDALRAAEPPPVDIGVHPALLGVAGEYEEGPAS
jgi:hypothetical protein